MNAVHAAGSGQSPGLPAVPVPEFRWQTRIALPAAILLGFAALFAGSLRASLVPAVDVEAVPVVQRPALSPRATSASSSEGTARAVVQAAGWIEPAPYSVHAAALTDGTVEEVLFLEGEAVEAGQVLARLVGDDARLALRRADAEATAARESWEANIEPRRAAAVAAAVVEETSASLALARAELAREAALLRLAERNLARRLELIADGSVTEEEFDASTTSAEAQRARVAVAERRLDELAAQLQRAAAEESAAAQSLALRTAERRALELAEVALAEAQLRVARLEIRAPITGVVMRRLVEPGSRLLLDSENAESARVAEIYDPARLQVRVDVPLADSAKVTIGQPADVTVEVLPDRMFQGVVSSVTHRADIAKNTLEVKVALRDTAPELRPEMLARVRFRAVVQGSAGAKPADGLSVFAPEAALQSGAAWVVSEFDGEFGVAAERRITTGKIGGDGWVEVLEGLSPGDLVIVTPADGMAAGQRVRLAAQGGS